jgi:hypothetical protein
MLKRTLGPDLKKKEETEENEAVNGTRFQILAGCLN